MNTFVAPSAGEEDHVEWTVAIILRAMISDARKQRARPRYRGIEPALRRGLMHMPFKKTLRKLQIVDLSASSNGVSPPADINRQCGEWQGSPMPVRTQRTPLRCSVSA